MIQHSLVADVFDGYGFVAISLFMLWATLLLGSAWIITQLLRHASAAVRYCVWQYTLMGLLALPLMFTLAPGIPVDMGLRQAEPNPASNDAIPPITAAPTITPNVDLTKEVSSLSSVATPGFNRSLADEKNSALEEHRDYASASIESPRNVAHEVPDALVADKGAMPQFSWTPWLLGVWVFGVVMQLAWLVWCVRRASQLVSSALPVDDPWILQIQEKCQRQFLHVRQARILKSARVSSPVAVGVRHPTVLLPVDCGEWAKETIRMVLSHELAHVERRDIFWQLMARTAAALYWFHPLTWLALSRMRQERERACDDRVLLTGVSAVDYAAGLAEFAAVLSGRRFPLVGSLGMAEHLPLEDRVRSILDASVVRAPASRRIHGLLLAVTTILVLVLGILRPFGPAPMANADGPNSQEAVSSRESEKSESQDADVSDVDPAPEAGEDAPRREPKQLPSKGSMQIRVVGLDGQPIAGAKLFANVSSYDRNAAEWDKRWTIKNDNYVTGPDGSVEIKLPKLVEDLRLWASKDGHAPMFAIWWPERDPNLTALPDEFTYHLHKGTILGGIVKNDEGQPIEGVKVEARYSGKGIQSGEKTRAVFDAWLSEGDGALTTDAEGRWRLDNVPPGDEVEVYLKLSHPDYIKDRDWGQLQRDQFVTTKSMRAETAVVVLHQGVIITGTVTDPDGQPVKDAVVVWGDHPYWDEGSQEVHTDEKGVYRFPPLPTGPMHVTVIAQGWMPDRTKIEIASGHPPVNFMLKHGKKLRIRFVDQSGKTVPRVAVAVDKWHGAESLYNDRHPNVLDTGIPNRSDEDGIYQWDWAPDSPVVYRFNREGFADATGSLTADDSEQVFTLLTQLRIVGRVVAADTQQPIKKFAAVPIIHFRADFPSVEHESAVEFANGNFSMEFDRTDVQHGIQFEAPGHATLRVGPYPVGSTVPPLQIRMTPADRFRGRVLNSIGHPVSNARVYVGSYSEHLYLSNLDADDGGRSSNYRVKTNEHGEFEIAHQLDRYALTVVCDEGYGEVDRQVGEIPGAINLRRWAKVSGKLVQAGKPVGNLNIELDAVRDQGGDAPRGHAAFFAVTAEDGSFVFNRVPPVACRVEPSIHWSVEGPLTSARSMPISPAPGEEITLSLGGGGAEVSGRVTLDPPATTEFDYHFGLNYLVARRPGITPPPLVAKKGFDWRRGWSDAWTSSDEGRSYLQTLHHYFVKPDPDGKFRISGVEPGEYDLAFRLYGSTEGCLVHPVGLTVVHVTVPASQTAVDLGTIKVSALPGLKVGDAAPTFEFTGIDGKQKRIADARGKYVLVDFWASWCGSCTSKIGDVENLRQKHADRTGLVVVGANLDQDVSRAKEFLRERKLPWEHALLGEWSSTDVPKRFAVSSLPTYVLIGPDGRIVAQEHSLDKIATMMDESTK